MATQALHLFVFILASSYLISSSNTIPMSRLTNLPNKGREFVEATKNVKQGQIISDDKMEDEFIEGRMDFEKNDYGPTKPNPIHTPGPPRT